MLKGKTLLYYAKKSAYPGKVKSSSKKRKSSIVETKLNTIILVTESKTMQKEKKRKNNLYKTTIFSEKMCDDVFSCGFSVICARVLTAMLVHQHFTHVLCNFCLIRVFLTNIT